MKKMISVLFLILSTFCFAEWKVDNIVDEFGDATNKTFIISEARTEELNIYKSAFRIMKINSKDYEAFIFFNKIFLPDNTLGKDQQKLKIRYKIDDSKPIEIDGYIDEEWTAIGTVVTPKFIENLKKGKMLKVIVEKKDGKKILSKYDLIGFTKAVEKLN